MKFTDVLKNIGLLSGSQQNISVGSRGSSPLDIERISHQVYHQQNPYYPSSSAGSITVGQGYHPAIYNPHGNRGYGLKLGGPGHTGGPGVSGGSGSYSAPAAAGVGQTGYGHTGYGNSAYQPGGHGSGHGHGAYNIGPDMGVGGAGGSYNYGHSTSPRYHGGHTKKKSKEHMEAMNPTVMVMTTEVARNRAGVAASSSTGHGNKFKELYRPDSKEIAVDTSSSTEEDGHVAKVSDADGNAETTTSDERKEFQEINSSNKRRIEESSQRRDDSENEYSRKGNHEEFSHSNRSNYYERWPESQGEINSKLRNGYFKDESGSSSSMSLFTKIN